MDAHKGVLPEGIGQIASAVVHMYPENSVFRRYLDSQANALDAREKARLPSMYAYVDASLLWTTGASQQALGLLMEIVEIA